MQTLFFANPNLAKAASLPRPLRFQARTKLKLTMKSMENMKKKLQALHILHG